jgi:hypothetical protein
MKSSTFAATPLATSWLMWVLNSRCSLVRDILKHQPLTLEFPFTACCDVYKSLGGSLRSNDGEIGECGVGGCGMNAGTLLMLIAFSGDKLTTCSVGPN